MRRIAFHIILGLILITPGYAQDKELSLQRFLAEVAQNHPLVRMADLLPQQAREELRMARGAFDPSIQMGAKQKEFLDKEYYRYREGLFKVPTWIGADVKVGLSNADGDYINPETSTSGYDQGKIGVSLPLARDLLIDARRAAVRQAEISINLSQAERRDLANKTIFNASKAWLQWWEAWQLVRLYTEGVELARFQLEAVKARIEWGALAVVDSLEASIELHKRQLMEEQAEMDFALARRDVETFLWGPELQPLELNDSVVPTSTLLPETWAGLDEDSLLNRLRLEHPKVQKIQFKLDQIAVDQQLAKNNFLPDIRLEANAYTGGGAWENPGFAENLGNNYFIGGSLYLPLFFRKERGKYNSLQFKSQMVQWEGQDLFRRLENEFLNTEQASIFLQEQIRLQGEVARQTAELQVAEQTRFQNGESTLFIVNRRERSLLAARKKLISLRTKQAKAEMQMIWLSGMAPEQWISR